MNILPHHLFSLTLPKILFVFFFLFLSSCSEKNFLDDYTLSEELKEELKWIGAIERDFGSEDSIKMDSITAKLLRESLSEDAFFEVYMQYINPFYLRKSVLDSLFLNREQLNSYNQVTFNTSYSGILVRSIPGCNLDTPQLLVNQARELLPSLEIDSFSKYSFKVNFAQFVLYSKANSCNDYLNAKDLINLGDSCLVYLEDNKQDTQSIMYIYNFLGAVNFHLALYDQTLEALSNEERYVNNDTSMLVRIAHNKSFALICKDDSVNGYKEAVKCLDYANSLESGRYEALSVAYNGFHQFFKYFENADSTEFYAQELASIQDSLNPTSALKTKLFIVESLNPAEGLKHLDEIEADVNKYLGIDMQAYVHKKRSELYEKQGRYKEALTSLQIEGDMLRKAFGNDKSLKVLELEKKYKASEKDRNIAQKELEIQAANVKREKLIVNYAAFTALLILVAILVFYFRERKNNKRKLKIQADYNKLLLENVEIKESNIANELHDSIGQEMVSINYQLQSKKYSEAQVSVETTLNKLRRVVREMHPIELNNSSVKEVLEKLLNNIERNSNIHMSYFIEDVELSANLKLQLYRISQEAVNNAIKHAEASAINLVLAKSKSKLMLTITDDGKGFDPDSLINSFGVYIMRQRAESIGAEFLINSRFGSGAKIQVALKH